LHGGFYKQESNIKVFNVVCSLVLDARYFLTIEQNLAPKRLLFSIVLYLKFFKRNISCIYYLFFVVHLLHFTQYHFLVSWVQCLESSNKAIKRRLACSGAWF